MSHDHSARIRELFEKIQHNTATAEELRQFIALTEEADQQQLLPSQEWEQAAPQPLPTQLEQRLIRKAAPKKPLLRRLLPYAAAAAVVTAALIQVFRPAQTAPETWATAYANDGEIKKVMLPDSSMVTLNARSGIRYNTSAENRTVHLEGQAFFDVRADQQRPFIVRSGELSTQVLGTSFDVKAYANEKPQVAVLTGKVKVADQHGHNIVLAQGDQAQYNTGATAFNRFRADTAQMSSWQQGIINMNNKTLQEVSAELERWYSVRIVLETPGIGAHVLSGTQVNASLASTLESVCFIFNLQYSQDGTMVRIRKK